MSKVHFIGDLHLGHSFIAKLRKFQTVEEHDEFIINMWNFAVTKRDKVFLLGDITGGSRKHYHLLDRLNGNKVVVLGNHDNPKYIKHLLEYVSTVAGSIKYKGFILTHIPIHPKEFEYRYQNFIGNIHAHTHENKIDSDPRYFCVSAEAVEYIPIEFDYLRTLFNQQNKTK